LTGGWRSLNSGPVRCPLSVSIVFFAEKVHHSHGHKVGHGIHNNFRQKARSIHSINLSLPRVRASTGPPWRLARSWPLVVIVVSERSRPVDLSDFGMCIPVSEHALLLLALLFSLSHSKSEC
jgi:hypothetical protein